MDQPQQATPKQNMMVLWIIWGALTSSVVVYLVVLHLSGNVEEAKNSQSNFAKILGAVAVINILLSVAVRKMWTLPTVKKLSPQTIMQVLPSCIISWALAEAVAVFGLVLGFSGYPISTYGTFFVASFATLMFLTPGFAKLVGSAEN